MLDLVKVFADAGATFGRPIMNYATFWQLCEVSRANAIQACASRRPPRM